MTTDNPNQISRRRFLEHSALAAGALYLPPGSQPNGSQPNGSQPNGSQPNGSLANALDGQKRKTEHVILVAFAGGVRAKEVIGTPANVPNLMRIANAGCTLPNVHCQNVGHYGAALSIFTGNVEVMGIRENERGLNPTIFEYLRHDAKFAANDVWLSTSGGTQGRLFACSDHPKFGDEYAATVLDGDGIFNVEFKKVLAAFGRPKSDSEHDKAILDRLAKGLDTTALTKAGKKPDAEQLRRVEGFILDELSGNTARITGPGASDAKSIRIGLNILRVFKPKVLGITLQNHDIAHSSYNGYVEVIRRNDAELGKLWDTVQQDPDLKDKTTIFILPEFGRDKNLNERNGLDHGDRSDHLRKVFLIAAGPDFKQNKVIKKDVRSTDVCPTVYSLFKQGKPRHCAANPIKDLFA